MKGELMIRKALIFLLLSSYFIILGFAAFLVGAGAGAGVYTYVNGELKTSYQATFDETNRVCTEVLKSLEMEITEKTSDRAPLKAIK